VVGGLEPEPVLRPFLSLDLTRLNNVVEIDPTAPTPGSKPVCSGRTLEAALNGQGFTLGHFPQSFEFSTLGGWIAARGAGHKSIRYGKTGQIWTSACASPCPDAHHNAEAPRPAAGGDLTGLLVGSEGIHGSSPKPDTDSVPCPGKPGRQPSSFPTWKRG
jgi:alkyldihydroxyacetonephosphate synthase